jgi:hypothetical protein
LLKILADGIFSKGIFSKIHYSDEKAARNTQLNTQYALRRNDMENQCSERMGTLDGRIASIVAIGKRHLFATIIFVDPHSVDPHSVDPHSVDPHSTDPHSTENRQVLVGVK